MGGILGGGWRLGRLLGLHHGAAFGREEEKGVSDELKRQERWAAVVAVLGRDVIQLDLRQNQVDLRGDGVELLAKARIANEL
jgi:hypothetical protein